MKKILSLMALLLLTVATAWAATVDDLVAVGPGYTFIADNITSNGSVKLTKNTLYDNDRIFAPTSNSVATNKGSSTIGGVSHLNSLRLKNGQDYLIIKVDGPCLITFYTYGDNARGVKVGTSDPGYSEDTGCDEYGRQTAGTTQWTCNVTAAGYVKIASYNGDFYIAGFEVTATEKTVYFDNTATQWGQVNIWAWNDTENFTGGEWPGVTMETTETANLYKWTTTGNPTKVIFSNNGASQTSQDGWDFVDGATYNKDGRVIIKQNFTLTFQTEKEWENIYAYAWNANENSGWTANKMTKDGDVWTATVQLENEPTGVLFHNGNDDQTPDFVYVADKTYEYMLNTYTATFTTDANWKTVKAYVWTGEGENEYLGDWPGTALTANEGVYTVTIKTWGDAPEKIQFNNDDNGQQTRDMVFTDGRAYKWITKTPLYAISSNQAAIASGTTFEVKDAENDVVATLTYGEDVEGAVDFGGATNGNGANDDYAGFEYMTVGNGTDGDKAKGTFYTIVPVYDGTITVGVRLNGGKKFYIKEDGTSMPGYDGITIATATNTSYSFPVKAGSEYKVYCAGSKLGFFGFDYTGYTKPELRFKVAGSMTSWDVVNVRADSYTFENLAAGTYQFKVIDGETWKGIADMTEVAGGLYWDSDGNVCFKLAEEGNVTVNYKSGELFTVEGNFVAPTVALAGSMNEWSSTANVLVPAEDKKTASVTVALNVDYYQLKMIVDGSWLAKNALYELIRENSSVEHVDQAIDDGPNIAVNADVAGDYTFTWEYATNTLTVTYPEKLPTVALAGTMNSWSATADVLEPAEDKQTASITLALNADDYEFKMVVDNHWLAKDAVYVLHRGWRTVDNVDQEISMGPNIKLQADVAGDYTFTWEYATNTLTVTFPTGDLTLYEDADNTDALTEWDGTSANVTLTRTLKTGMWNTFAAPFSIEIPTGWTVKELTGATLDGSTLNLTFEDATSIVAGKPYLVKVNSDLDFSTMAMANVTVGKTLQPVTFTYVDFVPTLGKTLVTGPEGAESNKDAVLFIAADNKLVNPSVVNDSEDAASYIKGFRAYFLLKGDAANARVFNLDLGEGETTGISTMTKNSVMMNNDVYDLQGRRVQNAAQKGVYIMNGRKVVKK